MKAMESAKLLSETAPTPEDISALTEELDREWPYMGELISVTGNIKYIDPVTGEAKVTYYEDKQMLSNGFFFEQLAISVDDEEVAKYYEPRHHLLVAMNPDEGGRKITVGCVAGFDDVIIDYPGDSIELIEKRLRHFHPATMETIDSLLLNAENEDNATLMLSSLRLEIDTTDLHDMQLLSDLQNYMTHVMEYDAELPYTVAAADRFFIQDPDGIRILGEGSKLSGFFWPQRIQFLPSSTNGDDEEAVQRFVACVEGVYMGENRGESVHMYLEPNYLERFSSIRR